MAAPMAGHPAGDINTPKKSKIRPTAGRRIRLLKNRRDVVSRGFRGAMFAGNTPPHLGVALRRFVAVVLPGEGGLA